MICKIRHIGLVVSNLDEALKFWCDIMGFSTHHKMTESGSYIDKMLGLNKTNITTVKLSDSNGNLLELLQFHSHPDKTYWDGTPYSTGLTHIAFTVSDINNLCNRFKSANLKILGEPQLSPDGSVKVVYASGPEGVLLELVEIIKK